MDAGDAIKGILGGKVMTREAWKGEVLTLEPQGTDGRKHRELRRMTAQGRSVTYQLTAEDINAMDWMQAG